MGACRSLGGEVIMQSTGTVTTPAAETAKQSALEHIFLEELNDLLAERATEETTKQLLAILDATLETLRRELKIEAQSGYVPEVLEHYPSWSPQVEHLYQEQVALYQQLWQ